MPSNLKCKYVYVEGRIELRLLGEYFTPPLLVESCHPSKKHQKKYHPTPPEKAKSERNKELLMRGIILRRGQRDLFGREFASNYADSVQLTQHHDEVCRNKDVGQAHAGA